LDSEYWAVLYSQLFSWEQGRGNLVPNNLAFPPPLPSRKGEFPPEAQQFLKGELPKLSFPSLVFPMIILTKINCLRNSWAVFL